MIYTYCVRRSTVSARLCLVVMFCCHMSNNNTDVLFEQINDDDDDDDDDDNDDNVRIRGQLPPPIVNGRGDSF